MAKGSSRKGNDDVIKTDSDETFAFIAGYTEGGAPYGVTWEQKAEIEAKAAATEQSTPPPQKCPVPLSEIVEEMQILPETVSGYYRRSTNEFVMVSDEHADIVDEGVSYDNRADWEQEAIRTAAEVFNDTVGDFVALPSRHEIHEYSIMEDFCDTVKNGRVASDLFGSLSGKGAFRRFKETTRRHGIEQQWYRFRDEAFKEIAMQWCRDNDLSWTE